jgi:D-threo-aldose 1-dehydrogenase
VFPSSLVGRLILDETEDPGARDNGDKGEVFKHGRPNKVVDDYSEDATLRSIEDSLKRLKTDRIEIVWVHDVAQDFYGDEWLGVFETARKGAFKALDRLRDEGVIRAWGLGVNRVEPIELLMALAAPRPDGFLLAGRYTLLDHDRALQRVMPEAAAQELGIVVGGPYSSGASQPARIAEDRAALTERVPADFWRELRQAGLVHRDAPLPGGA